MLIMIRGKTTKRKTPLFLTPSTGSSKGPLKWHTFPVMIPTGVLAIYSTVKSYTKWLFQSKARGSSVIEKNEFLNSCVSLNSYLVS